MKDIKVQCRAARHCFLVSTALILLPSTLLYLVTNEQAYKLEGYKLEEEFYYETKICRLVPSNETLNGPDVINVKMRNLQQTVKFRNVQEYFGADPILFQNVSQQIIPDDAVRKIPPNKLMMVEDRMKKRKTHLAQKCSELGLDFIGKDRMHTPNPHNFFVNHRYHVIWCNVYKAASSSWTYNFNILAGYSPEFLEKKTDIYLNLATRRYQSVSLEVLQNAQKDSITFIIARHPFERLLSAYRDKFIFALPFSHFALLGRMIIRDYRKHHPERYTPKYPTFSEFVSWLLHEVRKQNSIDAHFVRTTKFCTPCLINFDIIAKFETLEEDQLYFIEKAGLANVIMPQWKNAGKGKKTFELMQTFYSQLTRKQLDGLYKYFRYDFEIFGYNASSYFSIVKTDKKSRT